MTELSALINNVRINQLPSSVNVGDLRLQDGSTWPAREIQELWEEQGSMYGHALYNLGIESELELRGLGGINDVSQTTQLETVMGKDYAAGEQISKLLRQHPDVIATIGQPEIAYADVVNNSIPVHARISQWFYGHQTDTANDPETDNIEVANRNFFAIRHFLTNASGVGVYSPSYGTASYSTGRFKFDLNREWNGPSTPTDLDRLDNFLRMVFSRQTETLGGYYLDKINLSDIDEIADEFAIAIKDYSDADNIPTARQIGSTGVKGYGLEKLPFIREVYFHQLYEDQNLLDGTGASPPGADTNFDTWVAVPDTQGIVIELGNPFEHEIDGNDLNGRIRVVIEQAGLDVSTWVYNDTGAPVQNIDARDDSDDEVDTLLLVFDQVDTRVDGNGDGDNLDQDLNLPAAAPLIANIGGLSFNPGGGDITVRLEVDVDNTGTPNFVAYDRFITSINPPDQYDHFANSTPVATAEQYGQFSAWRHSEKLNYISDNTGEGDAETRPDVNTAPTFGSHSHSFGTDSKTLTTTGTPLPDSFQLPLPDKPMRSVAELGWVHMFGFTDSQTFSERVDAIPLNEHFLLLDPTDPVYDVTVTEGVPHAALLMEVFTTVSPADDDRDNDNDGTIDNNLELFVPGTLNVNTAPMHILTLGSPIGEDMSDSERLMRSIVAYRDEPIRNRPGEQHTYWSGSSMMSTDPRQARTDSAFNVHKFTNGRLDEPGIESIGELLYINPDTTGANDDHNMLKYGLDGTLTLPGPVDMYPAPDDTTANGPPLDQGDDNEQLLARFQMLSQAYTVRSDRFVVYGVVRGYDGGDFTTDPAETARFLAIIDRSSMINDTEPPRILGFIRLQ